MVAVFIKLLNMSISATWLVFAVLLLRLVLKKAPKWVCVLLWGMVAVRLICPFSLESVFSLIPSGETVTPEIMMDATPELQTGIPVLNSAINPIVTGAFAPNPGDSMNPLQLWIPLAAVGWLVGMILMLLYTAVSYFLLRRRVATAVLLRKNIYQSEQVDTPFVLGIINPRIYLPFRIDGQNLEYVISHEESHIRRRDHWWKPFGFVLLALYWFNPFMWLGYIFLCRDIELACDEKVIREMDNQTKAAYTRALVDCSVNRRSIAACPLAFGEVGVKQRVRSVLNYRKPGFWIIIAAIATCAVIAVCFLTDPTDEYGIGIRSIKTGTDEEGTPAIILDYLFLLDGEEHFQKAWITELGEDAGEYTQNGMGTYDGDLGPYRIMIKFKRTKPGAGFQRTHTPGQVYSLQKPAESFRGELKYKVAYPPDYSMVIYIGSDKPFGYKEPALYNVKYLGGKMYIRLYNVRQYEESNIVAVSGKFSVPLVSLPAGASDADRVYALNWLTVSPDTDPAKPFALYQNGQEVLGQYTVYEVQTTENREYTMLGVVPQYELFHRADHPRSYMILVTFSGDAAEQTYAFGLEIPGTDQEPDPVETVSGRLTAYYKNADGTWQVNGHNYKYRLEIIGRSKNATADATFIFLSNLEKITYEQAVYNVFASNSTNKFTAEEAVCVDYEVPLCVSIDENVFALILPRNGHAVGHEGTMGYFIPHIDQALVEAAEKKLMEETAAYSRKSDFYLKIEDDYLCLAVEVIENIDPPDRQGQGSLIIEDHKHLFFSQPITPYPVDPQTGKPQ